MRKFIVTSLENPRYLFLLILSMYLVGFFARVVVLNKTVYGDGLYYFSTTRSLAIDHDVNFTNEYRYYGLSQPQTKMGLPANVYPIGPSLFWLQPFYLVHGFVHGDGYSLPYQIAVGLSGVFAVFVGLILLFKLLGDYFDQSVSLKAIILLSFATNLWYYGSLDTVNSHSVSFLVATVIITLILKKRNVFITGVLVGLLSLTRTQDALFLLLLPWTPAALVAGSVGFIIGFLPQLLDWQLLYGTAFTSPYLDSAHTFNFLHPKLIEVLFSSNNGLLFWTPYLFIGIGGLLLSRLPKEIPQKKMLLLFCIAWLLIASWSFWWQGASFSGRMFISLLPALSFGFASVLKKLNNFQQNLLTGSSVVITFLFMLLYYASHHVKI